MKLGRISKASKVFRSQMPIANEFTFGTSIVSLRCIVVECCLIAVRAHVYTLTVASESQILLSSFQLCSHDRNLYIVRAAKNLTAMACGRVMIVSTYSIAFHVSAIILNPRCCPTVQAALKRLMASQQPPVSTQKRRDTNLCLGCSKLLYWRWK